MNAIIPVLEVPVIPCHVSGAYAPATERAMRSDVAGWITWCAIHHYPALPAGSAALAEYVDHLATHRKPATIRRHISSIATYHHAAGMESPTGSMEVRLALKRMARTLPSRQRQANPINRDLVERMLATGHDRGTLRNVRDMAILVVAYDTLCRRSEIAALDVEDVQIDGDGAGTILVRRGKTDQAGSGMVRYLAADTVRMLTKWMAMAGIVDGPLFRGIDNAGVVGDRLSDRGVDRALKRLAELAGCDPSTVSGHSTRVGAAQDMVAAGLDVAGVMQAGGWKSPVMVARYTERLAVRRGAAAQLAISQGRR